MTLPFQKFDGAGNDFVLIDARTTPFNLSAQQIARICHRRFGVGADGLMALLPATDGYHFRMAYYNSDGLPASMCGNGARCISVFAYLLGASAMSPNLHFLADDGPHHAQVLKWDDHLQQGVVQVSMCDVEAYSVRPVLGGYLLNTGVPHLVVEVDDVESIDVPSRGRVLRFDPALGAEGANVNFVQRMADGSLRIRTYERGVEDETFACGTGVTAASIVTGIHTIHAVGGSFEVAYTTTPSAYTQVMLTGPVQRNFLGNLYL